MTKLTYLFALSFTFIACAQDVEEEESSSTSELSCPSPTKDREGFIQCVKNKTASSKSGSTSSSGRDRNGNGGTSSSSQNGGSIQIGDINSGGNTGSGGKCSNLSISCDDNGCTCRGNGGPEKSCDGSNCQQICCP